MPGYSKVQFIAWEIYTGPIRYHKSTRILNLANAYGYAGIMSNGSDRRVDMFSQCKDIDARVAFTEKAIQKALEKADKGEDVLKVFMGPEFLYRGVGGAYLHDMLNGWAHSEVPDPYDNAWPGLFGGLKDVVAKEEYKDWVFVFGTTASASFATKKDENRKEIIDFTKFAECYNTSLIQLGGSENRDTCFTSRKHLKSKIDYVSNTSLNDIFRDSGIRPLDFALMIPADDIMESEGGAVFVLDGVNHTDSRPIKFGIEICLDHHAAWSYPDPQNNPIYSPPGRLRTNNEYVDLQLVPSCGMDLKEYSVSLLPVTGDKLKSYAFNCDGNSNLNYLFHQFTSYTDYGSHVQIWNQSDGDTIKKENQLETVSNDFSHIDSTKQIRVNDMINLRGEDIYDTQLWNSSIYPFSNNSTWKIGGCYEPPKGSGYVQVFNSRELLPNGSL